MNYAKLCEDLRARGDAPPKYCDGCPTKTLLLAGKPYFVRGTLNFCPSCNGNGNADKAATLYAKKQKRRKK
uniref:Uncharacterized protein n=1 Tax=uncultured Caudovirales phage TaxID=2100421 RepID=A0A6J5LAL0_9CAUD|nr:hypothetical protein UFOVP114_93 [uncultured Caudovirales phage]